MFLRWHVFPETATNSLVVELGFKDLNLIAAHKNNHLKILNIENKASQSLNVQYKSSEILSL